jgi:hypothetical protein
MSDNEEEDKSPIKYSGNYGGITQESQFWDDFEDYGEKKLLNLKLIKIRIYSGKFNDKDAIFGVGFTYKDLINGKEIVVDHKGSNDFIDVKEFIIKPSEYVTDFHIRFTNEAEYISQLGYTTNKGNPILVGSEEGEDKTILSNGGDNIIVGTFGCVNKKLDATGVLYINKKEYFKKLLNGIFILRHIIKKDKKFKEEWDKKQKDLPKDTQFVWRAVNLPEAALFQIIRYCSI